MFDWKGKAELRSMNVRSEIHGDETVPAVDIMLMVLDVPVSKISSLVPDMEKHFYTGDQPILQEITPFPVHHKVENVEATIAGHTMKGCDIKKGSRVWPRVGKVANVLIKVQTTAITGTTLKSLLDNLRETVDIKMSERQLKLADMEQGAGGK